jgi:hypothetical protein
LRIQTRQRLAEEEGGYLENSGMTQSCPKNSSTASESGTSTTTLESAIEILPDVIDPGLEGGTALPPATVTGNGGNAIESPGHGGGDGGDTWTEPTRKPPSGPDSPPVPTFVTPDASCKYLFFGSEFTHTVLSQYLWNYKTRFPRPCFQVATEELTLKSLLLTLRGMRAAEHRQMWLHSIYGLLAFKVLWKWRERAHHEAMATVEQPQIEHSHLAIRGLNLHVAQAGTGQRPRPSVPSSSTI